MIAQETINGKVNEGLSIRALGKYFNLSYTAIRYILKKYNCLYQDKIKIN
jgi:hypothetical protein